MLRSLYSAADIVRNAAITEAGPQRRRLNRLQLGKFDMFFCPKIFRHQQGRFLKSLAAETFRYYFFRKIPKKSFTAAAESFRIYRF